MRILYAEDERSLSEAVVDILVYSQIQIHRQRSAAIVGVMLLASNQGLVIFAVQPKAAWVTTYGRMPRILSQKLAQYAELPKAQNCLL